MDRTLKTHTKSEFKSILSDTKVHDGLFLFLQNIFHLYPEEKYHLLIKNSAASHPSDMAIYEDITSKLSKIRPFMRDITYSLPALKHQKEEMTRQTISLLDVDQKINGYLEIGSTGRYVSHFRKHLKISGPLILMNDIPPSNSPGDIFERGQLSKIGDYVPLNNYSTISEADIPAESLDLVTCYIGLHHSPEERLGDFIKSIHRILRPGGIFILRDHDAPDEDMKVFASLIHTVFNLGLGVAWETNESEIRNFAGIEEWSKKLTASGFSDSGQRLLQKNDPSRNLLLKFKKN